MARVSNIRAKHICCPLDTSFRTWNGISCKGVWRAQTEISWWKRIQWDIDASQRGIEEDLNRNLPKKQRPFEILHGWKRSWARKRSIKSFEETKSWMPWNVILPHIKRVHVNYRDITHPWLCKFLRQLHSVIWSTIDHIARKSTFGFFTLKCYLHGIWVIPDRSLASLSVYLSSMANIVGSAKHDKGQCTYFLGKLESLRHTAAKGLAAFSRENICQIDTALADYYLWSPRLLRHLTCWDLFRCLSKF